MELKKYLEALLPDQDATRIEQFSNEKRDDINESLKSLFHDFITPNMNEPIVDNQNEITDIAINNNITEVISFDNSQQSDATELVEVKIETHKEIFKPTENPMNTPTDTALQVEINNKHIVFPNAKVGQEYNFAFDIDKLQIAEVGDYWITGLDVLGLSFNKEDGKISGIPTTAGEHKISLNCKRKDWQEGKPIFERLISLIVNPDPRSLWNNIATPSDIEYYKPDSDSDFIKVVSTKEGGFLGIGKKDVAQKDIVAASQRGRSHAHEGKARDDHFKNAYDQTTQWYITTVADGAGSAKFSREGSRIACDTVVDTCLEKIKQQGDLNRHIADFNKNQTADNRKKIGDDIYNIIGAAAFQAHKVIEKEAVAKGNSLKDYSTTLIVSLCRKFDFGWFVAAFWVGDGGIGIYNKEKAFLKILGEPDGGEFAGQTRFLTMKEIVQPAEIYRRLRFEIVEDFTALILMTDGITDPKFETDANLSRIEKWNNLWEDLSSEVEFTDDNEQTKEQLLHWLNFWSPGNHDDRTIAILF